MRYPRRVTETDLHVVSLRYSLIPNERHTYQNPPAMEFETDEARFRLADGKLTCEMRKHFASVEAARAAIEPTLEAWEVDADLRRNRGELRFKFDGQQVIDRSPVQSGAIRGIAHGVGTLSATGTLSVHTTRTLYPDPPPGGFLLTPDAKTILDRYRDFLDGRQSLETMSYFCLTVVLRAGQRQAAEEYQIEIGVLRKMGELSSTRGDPLTGRKASFVRPLTASERAWLEATVKKLIWQLGTPKVERSLLKMSDLPAL
jgi:hypothetical protein